MRRRWYLAACLTAALHGCSLDFDRFGHAGKTNKPDSGARSDAGGTGGTNGAGGATPNTAMDGAVASGDAHVPTTTPMMDGSVSHGDAQTASTCDVCDELASCDRKAASSKCVCPSGYDDSLGDGRKCIDRNECMRKQDNCHDLATCTNTPGAFVCQCKDGYHGDGVLSCEPNVVCMNSGANCAPEASCHDVGGTSYCVCATGYLGDGSTCMNIDECTLNTDNCDMHASCDDNPGGFTCTCDSGWTGGGTTCSDVDECMDGSDNCDDAPDACVNTPGTFTCTCPSTHYGSGIGGDGCKVKALAVAAGGLFNGFTCAILATGAVKCWGAQSALGYGDTVTRGDTPGEMGDGLPEVALSGGSTPTAITAGGGSMCVLFSSGSAKCWGQNNAGQLGLGDTTIRGDGAGELGSSLPFIQISGTITSISQGLAHSCARLSTGTFKCWGNSASGQVGLGTTDNYGDAAFEMDPNLPAVSLNGNASATATSMMLSEHSCAVMSNGAVKCWGRNQVGQLGIGDTSNRGDATGEMGSALPAVSLGTGLTATSVTQGQLFACALLNDQSVKCWGDNSGGQLGTENTTALGSKTSDMGDNLLPISLGRSVTAIAAGATHVCAILDNGSLKCWGGNSMGQLGLGDANARGDAANEMGSNLPAVSLGSGRTVTAVAAGAFHTCAVLDNGGLKCWGRNNSGELGLGDAAARGASSGQMGDNLPYVDLGH